jgi:DNA-binding transcriptional LysR family regulator
MTAALATAETDRLSKLIRLTFTSDKTGEIAAAVAAVRRLLESSGLDAHWLADAVERGATPVVVQPEERRDERDDRSDIWFCFHRRHRLSPKERAFIENVVDRSRPLSNKQRQWLHDIVERLVAA